MLQQFYTGSKFALMLVLIWVLAQVALSLRALSDQAGATLTDARRVILVAGGVAGEVRASLKEFNKTEASREKYYNDSAKQLQATLYRANQTMTDLDALVTQTNANFTATFTEVNTDLAADQAGITPLLASANRSVTDLDQTAKAATVAMTAAGNVLADPSIPASLKSTQETSAQLAASAAHLEKSTADIQEAVHRWTRPPSVAKSAVSFILDVGSKVANIVTGFFK